MSSQHSLLVIAPGRAGLPSRVCGIMNLISSETTTTQGSGSRDSREGVLHPADDGQQARTAVQAHFFLWRSHTFCYHAQYSKLTKTGPMSTCSVACWFFHAITSEQKVL